MDTLLNRRFANATTTVVLALAMLLVLTASYRRVRELHELMEKREVARPLSVTTPPGSMLVAHAVRARTTKGGVVQGAKDAEGETGEIRESPVFDAGVGLQGVEARHHGTEEQQSQHGGSLASSTATRLARSSPPSTPPHTMDDLFSNHTAVRRKSLDCRHAMSVPCSEHQLLILQTTDGASRYARMLDETQDVQLAYASRWGHSYLRWDGIMRGKLSWLATYNRIYMLHEVLKFRDTYKWVLYIDPDAVFVDPDLSLDSILRHEESAIIVCQGLRADLWYDINIGVALFNLRHPMLPQIVDGWLQEIQSVDDEQMEHTSTKDYVRKKGKKAAFKDDQRMLQLVLKHNPQWRRYVRRYTSREGRLLFNGVSGKLIAHKLRLPGQSYGDRLADIRGMVKRFFEKQARRERSSRCRRAVQEGQGGNHM